MSMNTKCVHVLHSPVLQSAKINSLENVHKTKTRTSKAVEKQLVYSVLCSQENNEDADQPVDICRVI